MDNRKSVFSDSLGSRGTLYIYICIYTANSKMCIYTYINIQKIVYIQLIQKKYIYIYIYYTVYIYYAVYKRVQDACCSKCVHTGQAKKLA